MTNVNESAASAYEAEPGLSLHAYATADETACIAVFDSNVPAYFVDGERAEFRAFLADLPGPYFVMRDGGGAVVGCGGYALVDGSDVADLCWGMVRRDLQQRGLGRRLTELRLAAIRHDASARAVRLATSQHTRGFYERFGFRVSEIVTDDIAPGLDRCEMLLQLQLDGRQ